MIPLIFLIALILISIELYKERNKKTKAQHEAEQLIMRQIEAKVLKTIKEKAEYWDNFNIALYVEYLEVRNL